MRKEQNKHWDQRTWNEVVNGIDSVDEASQNEARKRWMSVAKPLFSLGKLEDAVIQIAGIKGTAQFTLKKKGLLIFCADNGVVEEGVTQTGQEVTAIVADNFTKKQASVAIMSQVSGVDLFPVDVGMATNVMSVTSEDLKVSYGTKNFAKEPAMSKEDAWKAILIGIHMVEQLKDQGYDILATGEMGIGNTTTSSAIAAVLLNRTVEEVTGKGAGLTREGLQHKKEVIQKALKLHNPDATDVLEVLSKVGGLDIAAMVGTFLGGALYKVPIVVDGFISAVAALCAVKIAPFARGYMLPSHVSKEPAAKMLLDELEFSPLLTCDMCLGEGSGAVAVFPLLEMGLQVYLQMSTFEENHIAQYEVLQ